MAWWIGWQIGWLNDCFSSQPRPSSTPSPYHTTCGLIGIEDLMEIVVLADMASSSPRIWQKPFIGKNQNLRTIFWRPLKTIWKRLVFSWATVALCWPVSRERRRSRRSRRTPTDGKPGKHRSLAWIGRWWLSRGIACTAGLFPSNPHRFSLTTKQQLHLWACVVPVTEYS